MATGHKSLSASPDPCASVFAITSGNSKEVPVVPAGGAKESAVAAAVSSQGELASESAIKDRQRTQVNMATPVTVIGKTVAGKCMEKIDYVNVHTGVAVTPNGRSTVCVEKDLPRCSALFSGEASGKVEYDNVIGKTDNIVLAKVDGPAANGLVQLTRDINVAMNTVKDVLSPLATVMNATEVSLETPRELCVLEPEVAWDSYGAALRDKTVPEHGDDKMLNAKTDMFKNTHDGSVLMLSGNDRCEGVHVFNEAPPEQGAESVVLQPALVKNVLPQSGLNKSDVCKVSVAVPLCPSGSAEITDWDRWTKSLLALLEKASVGKSEADMISAVPDEGPAEQLVCNGAFAAADDVAHKMEAPSNGERTEEVMSVIHKGSNDVVMDGAVPNELMLVEVPEGTAISELIVVKDPNVVLCDVQRSGQLLAEDLMPVEFACTEAAVDNHSAGCSSSPDTALRNMGEIKYDKCIDVSDHDEKCSMLAIFDGMVAMGDLKNNGRPDGLGQVDLVVENPENCSETGNDGFDTEVKGKAEVGPLEVQEGNSGEGFLRFEELLGSEKDPGKQWLEGNGPKRSKVSHDLETSEWRDSQDVLQRETRTRPQSYEDVGDETDRMKHAVYMGKQVMLNLDSVPGEHPTVVATSSEVDAPLKVSDPQAAVNEPLHVSNKVKVPKNVWHIDVECVEITDMLVDLLELVKAQSLYTWVPPLQSAVVVLCGTNGWSQVVQPVPVKISHQWNWLVRCFLIVWQVISRFPVRVLPHTVQYGRHSGGLLEMSEVSPPDVVMDISASAVRGVSEQCLVNGVDTASPVTPPKKEGPDMDAAKADILSLTYKEVQDGVPGDTLKYRVERNKHCDMEKCELAKIGTARNGSCVVQCQLLGQLPTEIWTTGEVKPCEGPIGDSCSPVCCPSLGLALTNPKQEMTDTIGNWRKGGSSSGIVSGAGSLQKPETEFKGSSRKGRGPPEKKSVILANMMALFILCLASATTNVCLAAVGTRGRIEDLSPEFLDDWAVPPNVDVCALS
ncbi:uncharacterized protein LOC120941180 [Rana temporaria]|uniref:uncharacterized protein LOC120941180 n=1 Tax=Rana temporaria TaxID=8407 RepID=UPI001AACEAE6|nr:uncharacterized protein LOC120941180 [Rana temporaria]